MRGRAIGAKEVVVRVVCVTLRSAVPVEVHLHRLDDRVFHPEDRAVARPDEAPAP